MPSSPLTPLSLHILLSLVEEPLHGYGILKAIEDRTDGAETPSTGALYLALQRLEREGHIEPGDTPAHETDARRRYWVLTPEGREAARDEVERLAAVVGHPAARMLRAEG
jgi:DNA-binding PadR family transcriptional regulator